jgi:hypothetical protein
VIELPPLALAVAGRWRSLDMNLVVIGHTGRILVPLHIDGEGAPEVGDVTDGTDGLVRTLVDGKGGRRLRTVAGKGTQGERLRGLRL